MNIEKHNSLKRGSSIAIRPYVEHSVDNMGLQRYDMVLFDNIMHSEPIVCLEQNGVKRYVTGLNEFAPEVQNLPEEEKQAKIIDIRKTVSAIEKKIAANIVDVNDENFWSKLKKLHPSNSDFWDTVQITCGNEPVFLDVINDPFDEIKYHAILAGGFSFVAPSLQVARSMNKPTKFYLDKAEDTIAIKTEIKKLRNKALGILDDLYNTNVNKLFYICKVLDPNSMQYRKSTPTDVMYDNVDKYINGEGIETSKKKAPKIFIDLSETEIDVLKIRAIIKDATYNKLFITKSDGMIYHAKTSVPMGKTPSDLVVFLNNPLHEDILQETLKTLERFWNE